MFGSKPNHGLERTMREIIMTHALSAERLGPGGFDAFLDALLEKFDTRSNGEQHIGRHEYSCRQQSVSSRVGTTVDVERVLARNVGLAKPRTMQVLRQALELAGFGGRVIVEKTKSQVPSVELVLGYTFELEQLLPIDTNLVQPRVFCIDGHIAEVSEIHHLLEASAEAKEPCVIFLRGVSDDVKHTLKVNYDRGSLRVLPIMARLDLEGMNTLVDLATVTGCDLVSSLKGDLISTIKYESAPRIDRFTAFKGKVVIQHVATKRRVLSHVTGLRTRRASETDETRGKLLDLRIKSLSPNHVVIRLPDDKEFIVNSQAIDGALRAIRSLVDHGVSDSGALTSTVLAADVHAERCYGALQQLGAAVIQET